MKFVNKKFDVNDIEILQSLTQDHRKPYTEIASDLSISRNTVNTKIRKLLENNIIDNYTVLVDPNWFFQKIIFLEIQTNPHEPWLAEQLQNLPQCEWIDGIIGEYSLIIKCAIKDDFTTTLNQIDSLMAKSASKKYQIIDTIQCYKENGHRFGKRSKVPQQLDHKDQLIIKVLRNQGKKSLTTNQISQYLKKKGIQISQPAVFKRIKKLEENNIIEGFTISINYKEFGYKTKFYVRIKVDPASYKSVALEFLSKQPQIYDLYRTGENYGLLAIIRTADIDSFNTLIQNLYTDSRILDTHTTLVLEERKK